MKGLHTNLRNPQKAFKVLASVLEVKIIAASKTSGRDATNTRTHFKQKWRLNFRGFQIGPDIAQSDTEKESGVMAADMKW